MSSEKNPGSTIPQPRSGFPPSIFLLAIVESPIIKIVMTGLSARNAEKRIRAVASSPTILTLSVFIFFIPSYEFYFLFLSATCNVLLVSYLQSTDCSVADTVADTVADVYLQHLI